MNFDKLVVLLLKENTDLPDFKSLPANTIWGSSTIARHNEPNKITIGTFDEAIKARYICNDIEEFKDFICSNGDIYKIPGGIIFLYDEILCGFTTQNSSVLEGAFNAVDNYYENNTQFGADISLQDYLNIADLLDI